MWIHKSNLSNLQRLWIKLLLVKFLIKCAEANHPSSVVQFINSWENSKETLPLSESKSESKNPPDLSGQIDAAVIAAMNNGQLQEELIRFIGENRVPVIITERKSFTKAKTPGQRETNQRTSLTWSSKKYKGKKREIVKKDNSYKATQYSSINYHQRLHDNELNEFFNKLIARRQVEFSKYFNYNHDHIRGPKRFFGMPNTGYDSGPYEDVYGKRSDEGHSDELGKKADFNLDDLISQVSTNLPRGKKLLKISKSGKIATISNANKGKEYVHFKSPSLNDNQYKSLIQRGQTMKNLNSGEDEKSNENDLVSEDDEFGKTSDDSNLDEYFDKDMDSEYKVYVYPVPVHPHSALYNNPVIPVINLPRPSEQQNHKSSNDQMGNQKINYRRKGEVNPNLTYLDQIKPATLNNEYAYESLIHSDINPLMSNAHPLESFRIHRRHDVPKRLDLSVKRWPCPYKRETKNILMIKK